MGAHSTIGVLSDSQELTESAASSNTIDMAVTNPQFGVGHPIFLCIRTEVAAGGTTPTFIIALQVADDVNFAGADLKCLWCIADTNGSALAGTDARFATAGEWILRQPLPYEVAQRHIRLYYTLAGTSPTLTIGAWLEDMPQSDRTQVAISPVTNP